MKQKIFSILLCLSMVMGILPTIALADTPPVVTQLMLPEDKKLAGYNQECDKAWVLENLNTDDYRYTYIQKLKTDCGYTDRELLYLYPATDLSADITYYTDADMTQPTTTTTDGAAVDGGVPDVVGTYYRKAVFAGGTDNSVYYPTATASSAFYVVDQLEGGTRRGFSLSLIQPNVATSNGLPQGVDEPFASVDEGWSWDPASGSDAAKLTLKSFKEEMRWEGVPIAQRAAAFTKSDTTATVDPGLAQQIALMKSLFAKELERGGGLILPGYEQVEMDLSGTNQIGAGTFSSAGVFSRDPSAYGDPIGIYVCNYEAGALSDLLGKLSLDGTGQYTPNPQINILGMEDKSLRLAGSGTLNVASDIRSPAGVNVGSGVILNVAGSIQTQILDDPSVSTRNQPESVLGNYTYTGSTASPVDVTVSVQGRVNIQYSGSYGIYSTGKLTADGAKLTVTQTSGNAEQLGSTAGLGSAYGVDIANSTVTVQGSSAGGAISAGEQLSMTNNTLTTSGYDYGLSTFGQYTNDGQPATLLLSGGNTSITAGKAAVYASDAALAQAAGNTDGVQVSLPSFFGWLIGGNYAVYAYTQNTENPVQTVTFSASPSANTVTPNGLTVGTVSDSDKTVATLLPSSGSSTAAGTIRAYYVSYDDPTPVKESEPTKEPDPAEIDFTDVSKDAWYYDAVQYIAQKELMVGVSDTEFAPERSMNRAMMIVLLYRIASEPAVNGTVPFHDTDASEYYANALLWAYQNDIAHGVGDGLFAPGRTITRQQLCAFLYRYSNASGVSADVLSSFGDAADISDYAVEAMAWAVDSGIIQGDKQQNLNPNASATRAQCAAILQRYLQLQED